MTTAKNLRTEKQKMGQFLTPPDLAQRLCGRFNFKSDDKVLEPGFGAGAFLIPVIDAFMKLHNGSTGERLTKVLTENVFGIELDADLYTATLSAIEQKWGPLPSEHNLVQGDFLSPEYWPIGMTHVVGNPPFGGYIAPHLQDSLDKILGKRHGLKIKKETYAFFLVKSLDLLDSAGSILFICSNTFLTIPTMKGLRNLLMIEGSTTVDLLDKFSDETNYPMVTIQFKKEADQHDVRVNGCLVRRNAINATGNLSWAILPELERYFQGENLAQYIVASSGMTTGKNEYFVREIQMDNTLVEPYSFDFFQNPITVEGERAKARLNILPPRREKELRSLEASGAVIEGIRISELNRPVTVQLPHPDYQYYNKAVKGVVYRPPQHAIFWKEDGKAVLTYKKTGNWYLRGVGGQPFFGREGITWRLISSRIDMRYLPSGYILDSGGPCAFLKPGVDRDELYFILGWTLTPMCTGILKQVLNHTQNIQSKDIERLPYPYWAKKQKAKIVARVIDMIESGKRGKAYEHGDSEIGSLAKLFEWQD